jgi:hypothetical protein
MDVSTDSATDSTTTLNSLDYINDLIVNAVNKGAFRIFVNSPYMNDDVMSILTDTYGYKVTKKTNDSGSNANYTIDWFGLSIPILTPTPTPTLTVTPTPSLTRTLTPTPTLSLTRTLTPTPSSTPATVTSGEFIYTAQTGIGWNSYGGNYLSFGRSQDGTNRTPLAGWYFKDSNNVVRRLLNSTLWFSGGNPSPYPNGDGWMAVADGSFYIEPTVTTITFYETAPA